MTLDLDTPIAAVTVSITDRTGHTLTERVELTAQDFVLSDIQAAAFWEEADPETYARFTSGEIKVGDLAGSALRVRAFLYAITRAKVADSRIRSQMQEIGRASCRKRPATQSQRRSRKTTQP